jgi:hypothetical protein
LFCAIQGAFTGKDVFDDVVPLCEANKSVIEQVFPNPENTLGKFVIHIFHRRIQDTVASQLYEKQVNHDRFLRNLASLYAKTKKVVNQLESFDLGSDSSFLNKITEQIFRSHLESYVKIEVKCLLTKSNQILSVYYEKLGHQKRALQNR